MQNFVEYLREDNRIRFAYSVFSPLTPLSSPRSRLSGCLFPAHVREKTDFYDVNSLLLSSREVATIVFMTGDNALPLSAFALAFSPVKIKIPVATADMRRHSDTLRGAQRRRKRGSRGENNRTSFLRSKVVVFPSYTKDIVFSRTCAGKRHPESRERGDERGGQRGRKQGHT